MSSIEKRVRNGKTRWYARYRDPAGVQRNKTFDRKVDAERFLTTVEASKLTGSYIPPEAGKITFKAYADQWLVRQTFDVSTRDAVALRLRLHVYPTLGALQLHSIKPSTIQAWLRGLGALASTYQRTIYANVSTILSAAVDDELIIKNPCRAASVRAPRIEVRRRIVPWTADQVIGVRYALPARYSIVATLGAGLGLRQGEVFGLSPDDVDFLRGEVHVRRQVKLYGGNVQAFALPKGRKVRTVPLPASVRDALAVYLAAWPSRAATLPWGDPKGESITVPLIITSRETKALNRNYFNSKLWKPALVEVGIEPTRENGCHALRHFYASVLLDAGESIKALSEYLGHADPGFTLRTYTHLMPASGERTRNAVDAALSGVPDVYPVAEQGHEAP